VSETAASFVFSGKGDISNVVRRKVLATARSLGYMPRRHVPAPRRGACAVLLGETSPQWRYSWNYIAGVVAALERALEAGGSFAFLLPVADGAQAAEVMRRLDVTGCGQVFAVHHFDLELFRSLEGAGVPVVIVNNTAFQDEFATVAADDFQGACQGAGHLLALGHRDILFVDYARGDMPKLQLDRFFGFRKALDEAGVPFAPGRKVTVDVRSAESVRAGLLPIFSVPGRPTAVFAHDDYLAAQVVHVLGELGLGAPRDVSVIAPGDVLDYSALGTPRISTMRIDIDAMGHFAAELMRRRLDDPGAPVQSLKVNMRLVDRGSCTAPEGGAVAISP